MSLNVESVHISSLIIHCLPDKLEKVISDTSALEFVEVAAHDPCGKLVVVLETKNEKGIMSTIDKIQAFDGVLNATMVYHELDC